MSQELQEYREKRDFRRTTEPSPKLRTDKGPLRFVVQKHRARQLHYDFRLELDGVLKSWSVPKGPSLDPAVKHMAVMVEDHPLGYAGFEGVIPQGEYGAGEVIVWDSGTYSPDEKGRLFFADRDRAMAEMREGLDKGKISIFLRGHKLKGSWTLVRIQKRLQDWLLMKHSDDYARPGVDILQEERSVLSGRTIEGVKAGEPPSTTPPIPLNPADLPGARPAPLPASVSPMLAHLAAAPFSNPNWIFEPKLDGYRVLTYVKDGEVTLLSRRGNNVTGQYAALLPDLSRQPASALILDGEIIALDERGRQCFQCLQNYLHSLHLAGARAEMTPLVYYVFDILYLDGYDLRDVTLRYRKELLRGILRPGTNIRLVDYFESEGERVYQAAVNSGLEGVIAKQTESRYESGRRSHDWLKIKTMLSDEFVIGGYSAGEGARANTLGALLLGYYDQNGRLVYAGHVGTGFDERTLSELKNQLDHLNTAECPFVGVPPLNAPTTWVKPELVAEVKFSEWTRDGRLRIPVFLRLREDKSPAEVRRSETIPSPASESTPADIIAGLLQQLQNPKDNFTIEVENRRISLNNLDKVLWPATKSHPPLTKRHFLTYLTSVSSYFLPHLKDRPLTLNRFPDGIYGEHFYQKHWNHPIPDFVRRLNIREENGTVSEYLVCDNLPSLLWLGQLANLEFHTWFSRANPQPDIRNEATNVDSLLDRPDFIIFDLDPYIYSGREPAGAEPELNREGFTRTCQVALWLKEVLDELRLNAFVKTSGKTGLHIYTPITRQLGYTAVRAAAETIGRFLLQRHPADITMEWSVEKRAGKVFLDYSQNVRGKTLASVYSPRPTPEANVSTPLDWEEVARIYPADFTILTLPHRLETVGDLWASILSAKRDLKDVVG